MKALFCLIVTITVLCSLCGCPKVEKSAGMALDNASEVIKSGEKKLWIDEETPEPEHDDSIERY